MFLFSNQILLVMSGILTMVLIVNPSMVVALLGAIFFFYLLIRIYIRPAQDLKRLEGIGKIFQITFKL